MITMHVLHMKSTTNPDILIPVIEPNEMINERTERNEVMGVVLFESTSVDRLAVKQAFATWTILVSWFGAKSMLKAGVNGLVFPATVG